MSEKPAGNAVLEEYEVSLVVEGRFRVTVKASSPEEANRLANEKCTDADFGPLEDIDWNTDHVEDSTGRYIYPEDMKEDGK